MAQNKAQSAKSGNRGGADKSATPAAKEKKKKVGMVTFFRQVRSEAGKVTWASRSETVAATIMVLTMTVVVALFLLTVDQIVGWSVRLITGL